MHCERIRIVYLASIVILPLLEDDAGDFCGYSGSVFRFLVKTGG